MRQRAGFDAVDRERLAAIREFADAALGAGVPDAVLPELRAAVAGHPMDEPLRARLILALGAAGHRTEALNACQDACARLAEELGIDPGAELRDAAHRAGLHDTAPAASPSTSTPVPAQLPHDLPTFAGRRTELDEVLALLTSNDDGHHADTADTTDTVVITAIGGMAGIGKTTLAVHWAPWRRRRRARTTVSRNSMSAAFSHSRRFRSR